jgi:phage N-6-adenine-methyltransferase
MNTDVMFSKASDEWATPQDFFDRLNAEFHFTVDAAATKENAKCSDFLGPGGIFSDALASDVVWGHGARVWLNPPYSQCRAFIEKAVDQARRGNTVVCLVPARVDTLWWHAYVWNGITRQWCDRVEVRFVRGRLKFGGSKNSAPFPSVVIVFRGSR